MIIEEFVEAKILDFLDELFTPLSSILLLSNKGSFVTELLLLLILQASRRKRCLRSSSRFHTLCTYLFTNIHFTSQIASVSGSEE